MASQQYITVLRLFSSSTEKHKYAHHELNVIISSDVSLATLCLISSSKDENGIRFFKISNVLQKFVSSEKIWLCW